MKKKDQRVPDADTMKDHYDFDYSKAVWGKTAKRLAKQGYPIMVMLEPEVAAVFNDSDAVNAALSGLIEYSRKATTSESDSKRRKAKVAADTVKE